MGCEDDGAEGFLYRGTEGIAVGGVFDDGAGGTTYISIDLREEGKGD